MVRELQHLKLTHQYRFSTLYKFPKQYLLLTRPLTVSFCIVRKVKYSKVINHALCMIHDRHQNNNKDSNELLWVHMSSWGVLTLHVHFWHLTLNFSHLICCTVYSFKNNPKLPSDTQNLHDSAPYFGVCLLELRYVGRIVQILCDRWRVWVIL